MKTKRPFAKTLIFTIAFSALIIAVAYIAYQSHTDFVESMVDQTRQQLLMTAKATARSLEDFINGYSDDLVNISRDPLLREEISKGIPAKVSETKYRLLKFYYETHKKDVDAIYALDSNGIALCRYPFWGDKDRRGTDYKDRPGVAYVIKERKPYISEPFYSTSGNLSLSILEPVFYQNKFSGIVRWLVSTKTIAEHFINPIKAGKEGYAWIFDNNKIILSHPQKDFVGRSVSEVISRRPPEKENNSGGYTLKKQLQEKQDYLNRVLAEEEGYGLHTDFFTDKKNLSAFKKFSVGGRAWNLIITMPYAEIEEPVHRHAWNTFGPAGCIVLLFGAVSASLYKMQRITSDKLEKEAKYLKAIAQTTKALRRSEQKLSGIIDSVTDHMFMVDGQFNIIWANDVAKDFFGHELLGIKCHHVYHGREEVCEKCLVKKCFEDGKVHEYETELIRADGDKRIFWCTAGVSAWVDGRPTMVVAILRDITARNHMDNQLKASLKEKYLLLQEIHHRVKNNMQVISSLIRLQSGYIKDNKYLEVFRESQNRIKSMALIHEKLYQSGDLIHIDFGKYIKNLADSLIRSYGVNPEKVPIRVNAEDIMLEIDSAIPCGLLVNELVSNSLKHAFPEGEQGEITIVFRATGEDEIELSVSDNGVGAPEHLDFRNAESFGLRLVAILAEDQLQGKIKLNRDQGTEFSVTFKKTR